MRVPQCICVDQHPGRLARTGDSACNYHCPGDYRSACGGYEMMNFYDLVDADRLASLIGGK